MGKGPRPGQTRCDVQGTGVSVTLGQQPGQCEPVIPQHSPSARPAPRHHRPRARLPPPRFPFRRAVPSPSGVSPAPFLLFPCGRRRLSGSGCPRRCRPRPGHRHRPRRAWRPQRREAAGAARGSAGPGRPRRAGE